MIKEEDKLVEGIWYSVALEDNFSSCIAPIKVMGKYHFVGRLVVHLNNKIIFNLNNGNGSVILPFENIKYMVPLWNKEKNEEDCPWE